MKLHNLNYKSNFTPFFIIILFGKNKNSWNAEGLSVLTPKFLVLKFWKRMV